MVPIVLVPLLDTVGHRLGDELLVHTAGVGPYSYVITVDVAALALEAIRSGGDCMKSIAMPVLAQPMHDRAQLARQFRQTMVVAVILRLVGITGVQSRRCRWRRNPQL